MRPRPAAGPAAAAAVLAVALLGAWALKRFYSGATAADLRFVLAPTTWLVETAGGHRFDWTADGYLSNELRFLIAPACAGVNFAIVAFTSLVLAFVRPGRSPARNLGILAASAAAAAAATLLANAARILVAIPLWRHGVSLGGLSGERLHELAGVAVFLGMLLLLHLAAHRLARAPVAVWPPLLTYAGVVLAVPLLRGAHARPEFAGHAALVLSAVAGVALVAAAGRRWGAGGRRASAGRWEPPGVACPVAARTRLSLAREVPRDPCFWRRSRDGKQG